MSGGLGNQMFQYAFYLSMKSKGIDCRIDDTLFYTAKMHNGFELDRVFSIPERLDKPSRLKKYGFEHFVDINHLYSYVQIGYINIAQRYMKQISLI